MRQVRVYKERAQFHPMRPFRNNEFNLNAPNNNHLTGSKVSVNTECAQHPNYLEKIMILHRTRKIQINKTFRENQLLLTAPNTTNLKG